MTLGASKAAAVRVKLDGLRHELKQWRALSEQKGHPLARHWSQILVVSATLERAATEIERGFDHPGGSEHERVAHFGRLGDQLLDIQRAWEFFRSKFAQRFVATLSEFLVTIDELAWACYEPAQRAAGVGALGRREPPLTFLNGTGTPFLMPRGQTYAAAIGDGGVRDERLRALIDKLPIPVIGMPWHQHVPDTVVVAHETAHAVEDDFGLGATLRTHVRSAVPDPDRVLGWEAWASELFADVYASLALGPAYGRALAEFIAVRRPASRAARPDWDPWGDYPAPTLRILVCAEVCKLGGSVEAADTLNADWRAAYGEEARHPWATDAAPVAASVLAGPYPELGDKALDTVISFDSARWKAATRDGSKLLRGINPVSRDVRHLVACASAAFGRDGGGYERSHGEAVLKCVAANVHAGRRLSSSSRARAAEIAARQRRVDEQVAVLFADGPSPAANVGPSASIVAGEG